MQNTLAIRILRGSFFLILALIASFAPKLLGAPESTQDTANIATVLALFVQGAWRRCTPYNLAHPWLCRAVRAQHSDQAVAHRARNRRTRDCARGPEHPWRSLCGHLDRHRQAIRGW